MESFWKKSLNLTKNCSFLKINEFYDKKFSLFLKLQNPIRNWISLECLWDCFLVVWSAWAAQIRKEKMQHSNSAKILFKELGQFNESPVEGFRYLFMSILEMLQFSELSTSTKVTSTTGRSPFLVLPARRTKAATSKRISVFPEIIRLVRRLSDLWPKSGIRISTKMAKVKLIF